VKNLTLPIIGASVLAAAATAAIFMLVPKKPAPDDVSSLARTAELEATVARLEGYNRMLKTAAIGGKASGPASHPTTRPWSVEDLDRLIRKTTSTSPSLTTVQRRAQEKAIRDVTKGITVLIRVRVLDVVEGPGTKRELTALAAEGIGSPFPVYALLSAETAMSLAKDQTVTLKGKIEWADISTFDGAEANWLGALALSEVVVVPAR